MVGKFSVTVRVIADSRTIKVEGRYAWTLLKLLQAGDRGCTPIDNPGPRWSAYVFNLKREHLLVIETVNEPHHGEIPGRHARYFLRSAVEIIASDDGPQAAVAA